MQTRYKQGVSWRKVKGVTRMKRRLCTLFAVLALLLSLCACGGETPSAPVSGLPEPLPSESGTAETVRRYISEPLDLPDDAASIAATYRNEDGSIALVSTADEYLSNPDGTNTNFSTARLWRSTPGGEAELAATLYENAVDRWTSNFVFAPDGTLWCSWRAEVGAGMSYARYSQDGAELCSFGPEAFPEAPSSVRFCADSEGRLCLVSEAGGRFCVLVYSTDGAGPVLEAEHPLGEDCGYIIGISPMDGALLLSCLDEMGYAARLLELSTGELKGPFHGPSAQGYAAGPGNSILALGAFSLYSLDPVSGESEKLCDYLELGVSQGPEAFYDDGSFLVSYYDMDAGGWRWSLVTPQEGMQPAVKIRLALSYFDSYSSAYNIYNLAAEFNRLNPGVCIELVDYTAYNTAEDELAGTVALAADMYSGNCPDILMLEGINYHSWARRGMLLELNSFMDGEDGIDRSLVFDGWLRALETNGGLYCLPAGFIMYTTAISDAYLDGREGLSFEDVDAIMQENPRLEYAVGLNTSRDVYLERALSFCASRLMDWNSGTCDFTGGLFEAILEQAAKQPEEAVTGQGTQFGYEWHYNEQQMLAEGRQLLYTTNTGLRYLRVFSDALGEDFTFCGFPGSGSPGAVQPVGLMGVSASTEHPEECWAFMKTLITENSSVMDGSTPLRSAAEAQVESYLKDLAGWRENGYDLTADMGKITQRGLELCDSVSITYGMDAEALSIIKDAAAAYFAGAKSAAETAQEVQSRVSTYMAEQS